MAEVDFPRGSAPTTKRVVKPRNPALKGKNNAKGTRPHPKRKGGKKEDAVVPNTKFNITPQGLTSDMLFLGFVTTLRQDEVILELPNNVKGVLRGHESIHFTLGQFLAVGVTGPAIEHLGSTMVPLSVSPSVLNKSIDVNHLREGMHVSGVVSRAEDRGYSVDIGIKDTNCFIAKTQSSLMIGQPIVGVVLSVDVEAKRVFLIPQQDPEATFKEIRDWKTISLQNIRPGNAVKAEVIHKYTNGLGVKIYNQTEKSPLTAFVPATHLPQPLSSYSPKFRVNGKVIYVDYITQRVMVTVLPHIVNARPDPALFANYSHLRGLTFTVPVPPLERPLCSLPTRPPTQALFVSAPKADDQETEEFIPTKKTKVVGLSYMLNVVVVSADPVVVADSTAVLDITDLSPGMVVDGSVSVVAPTGLEVKLSPLITAICLANHLTDAAAAANAPASQTVLARFKPEQNIKCRVLRIEQNTVYVTTKPTLVNSTLHVIASYEHCAVGKVAHGVVTRAAKGQVTVEFYNNVIGHIKTNDVSGNRVGEVVACQVVNCTPPESGKVSHGLTLTLDIELANPVPTALGITALRKAFAAASIGQIVSGIVSHADENGLTLVLDSGVTGLLPTQHLSDSLAICSKLLSAYYVGTKLSDILVLNKDTNNMRLILSRKASLRSLASEYENVKPGQVLPAHIKKIADDSITVGFLGTNKGTVDTSTQTSSTPYSLGQSVRVVVREVEDAASPTVDLSDKITTTTGAALLREYFAGVDSVWSNTNMTKLQLGEAVQGEVVEFRGSRTIVRLDNHVLAFVDATSSTSRNNVGEKVDGVVIDFDYISGMVQLSLDSEISNSKYDVLPTDTDLFGRVLLVNPIYLVVCVSFKKSRTLVYVPGNDFNTQATAHCAARVGDELRVVREEKDDENSTPSSRPIFVLRDTLTLLANSLNAVHIKKEEGVSDDESDAAMADEEESESEESEDEKAEEEEDEEEAEEDEEEEEDENDFEEEGDFGKAFAIKNDSSDDEADPDLDDLQAYLKRRKEKGDVDEQEDGDDEDDEDGWPAEEEAKSKSSKGKQSKPQSKQLKQATESNIPSKKFSKKFSKKSGNTKQKDTNTNKQTTQEETTRNPKRKNDSRNATNKKLRNK